MYVYECEKEGKRLFISNTVMSSAFNY